MNNGEVLVPAHRELASRFRNSLAAVPRDPAKRYNDIGSDEKFAIALLHVAVGIKSFRVLPHHHKIKRAEVVAQTSVGPRRPHIGKQVQILPENLRRIDLAALLILEIEGGGGTEDQAV